MEYRNHTQLHMERDIHPGYIALYTLYTEGGRMPPMSGRHTEKVESSLVLERARRKLSI
jgi:hypothetical protein